MKTIWPLLLILIISVLLSGCGNDAEYDRKTDEEPIQIVATVFPVYDWVLTILGQNPGNAQVTLLFDKGVDPHSYQPTAADIMKVSSCDLFFYIGGESDEWVEDILAEAVNKDQLAVNLLEKLGELAIQEEDEEEEYDEHIWLSLRNASVLCEPIEQALESCDPSHADAYKKNLAEYQTQLAELDHAYQETVDSSRTKALLFADRFPFIYLVHDYGLDHYAAFNGCSAETEASFDTIIFLAGKADELGLSCILTIEGADGKLAKTIIDSTKSKDQNVLVLDSLQSYSSEKEKQGKTYLTAMEENLEILREALN